MDTTPIVQQFWADAGTDVTLAIDAPITYIASIVPGTIWPCGLTSNSSANGGWWTCRPISTRSRPRPMAP